MTDDLAALAGRVLGVGFDGERAADAPLERLRALAPGAVVLFGRNVGTLPELRELVAALRALAAPAPLIGIDQEGGRVARIRDGVTAIPAAMALGALGDAAVVEQLGAALGRDLAALGFSVDFAPVADLALHDANTVIGNRAYGDRPHDVARLAGAFARGLERGGVAAALKHFPGHGDTVVDSHRALPRIDLDAATWRTRDLVPFGAILGADGASLVMSAHVVVAALDPERPATVSPAVLRVLRDELGFDGAIVTDDLEMEAIAGTAGVAEAAWRAIAAGADLALICHRLDRAEAARDAIVAAVERGDLPEARLRDAARRIDALRARFAERPGAAPSPDAAASLDAAARAVVAPREAPRLRDGAAVTVISFEDDAREGINAVERAAADSLALALRRRRVRAELLRVPVAPDDDDVDLLLETLRLQGEREIVAVVRRAHLHPAQHAAVARVLDLVPATLVVSAREPYDALAWPGARRVAATCGDDPLAFEGLAEVLLGAVVPAGRFPVPVAEAAAVG